LTPDFLNLNKLKKQINQKEVPHNVTVKIYAYRKKVDVKQMKSPSAAITSSSLDWNQLQALLRSSLGNFPKTSMMELIRD
jgi:hypothetical protein